MFNIINVFRDVLETKFNTVIIMIFSVVYNNLLNISFIKCIPLSSYPIF